MHRQPHKHVRTREDMALPCPGARPRPWAGRSTGCGSPTLCSSVPAGGRDAGGRDSSLFGSKPWPAGRWDRRPERRAGLGPGAGTWLPSSLEDLCPPWSQTPAACGSQSACALAVWPGEALRRGERGGGGRAGAGHPSDQDSAVPGAPQRERGDSEVRRFMRIRRRLSPGLRAGAHTGELPGVCPSAACGGRVRGPQPSAPCGAGVRAFGRGVEWGTPWCLGPGAV